MELGRLEKYKKQFKTFNHQIENLKQYLKQIITSGHHIIYLDRVTTTLDVPATDAIFLMSLAEKEHLVKKKLLVYSKKDDYQIGEYSSASEIPSEVKDMFNDKTLSPDEYYIDIIYEAPE